MSEEEKKPKKISPPPGTLTAEERRRIENGTRAAFKFAEDSRRDKDRE